MAERAEKPPQGAATPKRRGKKGEVPAQKPDSHPITDSAAVLINDDTSHARAAASGSAESPSDT